MPVHRGEVGILGPGTYSPQSRLGVRHCPVTRGDSEGQAWHCVTHCRYRRVDDSGLQGIGAAGGLGMDVYRPGTGPVCGERLGGQLFRRDGKVGVFIRGASAIDTRLHVDLGFHRHEYILTRRGRRFRSSVSRHGRARYCGNVGRDGSRCTHDGGTQDLREGVYQWRSHP